MSITGEYPAPYDENLLGSAIGSPQLKWQYGLYKDAFDIAADYAYGIGKNHCFSTGNKRTALWCMLDFLFMNGYDAMRELFDRIMDQLVFLIDGSVSKVQFAQYLRETVPPRPIELQW